jgi:glycosyltransferase involved in cell wall biosynthesis
LTCAPDVRLSVVIPCLNAADTIGDQLEALRNQEWEEPWEVIVADNGSTDASQEVVERFRERMGNLRAVRASDRRGAAHARNVGVRVARGEALAFCDADDQVADGWVAAMGNALARYEFVAARHDLTKLNEPWAQEKGESPFVRGLSTLSYPPYLPHAGTCGLGIRRELHELIGGFDESMTTLEDTDYCIRLQLAGATLHFVSDAVVHMRYRSSLRALYKQARGFAEGSARLQKKYGASAHLPARWKWPLRRWKTIVKLIPRLHRKGSRAAFVWALGWQVGRYKGSIRYRVLAL